MTCLTIGVGNSSLSIAVWEEAQCQNEWRLSTNINSTSDEYALVFKHIFREFENHIRIAIISSVVPGITNTIAYTLQQHFDLTPLIVSADLKHGLSSHIPKEIGADLLANAVAAHTCYTGPCMVFDFGTALSLTVLSGEGEILGITIFPGITTSYNALLERTALLHSVDLGNPTEKTLGKTTEESLQIGIINGYVGVVSYNIDKIEKEFGEPFHRIGTGGDCRYITNQTKVLHTVDHLHTLRGLRILAEMNLGDA